MGVRTEAVNVGGPSEQETLRLLAKLAFKKAKFGLCLHALREDRKTECLAETKHRAHDRGGLAIDIDRFDEGAVDLDLVKRKCPQIGKRRVAGTEVIHGDAHAKHLDAPQRGQGSVQVPNESGLGYLKLQS